MNEALHHELITLLTRIVGDKPLTPDMQRTALEMFARLATPVSADTVATDATAQASLPAALTMLPGFAGAGVGTATVGNRRLVYVHGICQHSTGFSDGWWNALQPFVSAFGAGQLGVSRLEVIWSDLVNQASAAMALGMGGPTSAVAPAPDSRAQVALAIRETLRDRADQQQMATQRLQAAVQGAGVMAANTLPATTALPANDVLMVTGGSGLSIPGANCIDDFSIYLVNDSTRQAVIDRFTAIVRAEFQAGRELDIISHSWGTVVAYEGLRELEDAGFTSNLVRNFFTVGSALSIGAVKFGLRSANKDGRKPASVRRWVNLDATGDLVGGPIKGKPFAVDEEFVNLEPFGCGSFLGLVNPSCAHGSYFKSGNVPVNRDIFGKSINL